MELPFIYAAESCVLLEQSLSAKIEWLTII